MNTQRALLPWILGGLSAAAVAVAVAALSVNRTAASISPPTPVLAAPAAAARSLPAPSPPPSADTSSQAPPQPEPIVAHSPAQDPEAPQVTAGQIWQCKTNGVKTFSNNPCGENSSLLDVGPINTMHPPPALSFARPYAPQPRYAPAYNDQSDSGDQDAYSDEDGAETGGNSYTIVQGVRVVRRRRVDHPHRPPSHSSAPVPRKY